MLVRFVIVATTFHLALIAGAGALVWWLARALRVEARGARLVLGFGIGIMALAAIALALGAVLSLALGLSDFGFLRLISQALFGEGVLVGVAVVVLLARRKRRLAAMASAVVPLVLLAIYWDAYHVEPRALDVTYHTLGATRSPRRGRLRIGHISDIQTDHVGSHERDALRAMMASRPDLILLTGDYVNERFRLDRPQVNADLRRLFREERVDAPYGVFAVRGTTDHDWPTLFEGSNVVCLTDQRVRVSLRGGRSLSLVGLDSHTSSGRNPPDVLQLVRSVPEDDLLVVIGHVPRFVAVLADRARVDLALAGHTHGGQVRMPLLGALITRSGLPRRYAAGLNDYRGVPLHVTRGVGMERGYAPQLRFLCRPEVCVLDVSY
jgi:uncharacterized protein